MADKTEEIVQESTSSGCIFCKIGLRQEPNTRIEYEDENIVIFPDLHPATQYHYLVIPKNHVGNPKSLKKQDLSLVEELIEKGKNFLQGKDEKLLSDMRIGFHWPPFNSIQHLHLHILAPVSQMGFISRQIHKPQSFWFVTADWMVDRLKNMPDL